MSKDELGKSRSCKYVAHDERNLGGNPKGRCEPVSADCVDVEVVVVDFEVDPVESESLHEAQDAFAEKCIYAGRGAVLIEDGKDRVAEDKRDEGIVSLGAVFDIDGRPEVKVFMVKLALGIFHQTHDPDQGHPAKHVEDKGYENQR